MEKAPAISEAPILVVDDDEIVRALARAALEGEGFAVVEAASSEEAVQVCAAQRFGLIIADVVMPGMDGYELCRALRAWAPTAFVPILMATGLDDTVSIANAYEAGATDFIAKPINWTLLGHRVRYILRASRAFDELRQNQERLIAAKEAAEEANRSKSDFLANMSHELRTPLNAIIGFSSIMQNKMFGPIEPKYAEFCDLIVDSGNHLLAIINSILDIARAEAGKLVLVEGDIDVSRVVAFSATIVREMAQKAQIDCNIDIAGGLPVYRADSAKLAQILINLLSNAVKFTPAGGHVGLSVRRDEPGNLIFRIEDSGIGMTEESLPVALAPFGQVDRGLARKYEGVGLGLPLTKRLVELHGGSLSISSRPGQGTTVTVQMPAERFGASAIEPAAAQQATG